MMNYSEAKKILDSQDAAKAVLAQYEKLTSAHEDYGFSTRRAFIAALKELDGGQRTGRRGRGLSDEKINEILSLKAQRKTNAEIARIVNVSPLTVGKYVRAAK
jgi:hypothetical protein